MILTPGGWVRGRVRFTAQIIAIEPDDSAPEDRFVLPGFIDLHVHGGGGADVMDGPDAVRSMAAFHARYGTTALLATTVTAPAEDLRQAASGIGVAERRHAPGTARVLGLHLEGPFINPGALGAQPPYAIPPDLDLAADLAARATMRVATVAPEMDADGVLLAFLCARGVRVQIGHTLCTAEQAAAALAGGASGFTHLFNAMTPFHHRAPGAVGCALAMAPYAEVIPDLLHVDALAICAALRAIPGLYGVTDAVAATGMPDGAYRLGRHAITKAGAAVRLADGTLAGSVLTMDRALRNFLRCGLDVMGSSRRLSANPASYLGLTDRGHVAAGMAADLLVIDASGRLSCVIAEGVSASSN